MEKKIKKNKITIETDENQDHYIKSTYTIQETKLVLKNLSDIIDKTSLEPHIQFKHEKNVPEIEELKHKCFVCEKQHYVMAGQIKAVKLVYVPINRLKTTFIIERSAPLYCWLKNNKKQVLSFYEEVETDEKQRKNTTRNKNTQKPNRKRGQSVHKTTVQRQNRNTTMGAKR